MARPKTRMCPYCDSSKTLQLVHSWKCYGCGHKFDAPRYPNAATKGQNVTPPSYKQQLARERLAESRSAWE